MPTLSSLIVQRQIASMREVEEAIARQVLHGGDLLTNLLEMAPDREVALTHALADSLGVRSAPPGRLPPPDEAALADVTSELALRHAIFPLALEGESLVVATSDPLSQESVAELAASIGRPLRLLASPFLRVREGIAAHYGIPLDRRLVKLVATLDGLRAPLGMSTRPPPVRRLADPHIVVYAAGPSAASTPPDGGDDLAPVSLPPVVEVSPASLSWPEDLPTPSTILASPYDSSGVPDGVRSSQVQGSDGPARGLRVVPAPDLSGAPSFEERVSIPATTPGELARWLRRTTDADKRSRSRPQRKRGPVAVGEAEEHIEQARALDAVIDAFFAFASQFFEYSAVFVVRGELAEGHDAWGTGTGRDAIVGIGVPLDLPSCLSRARDRKAPLLERVPDDALDRELMNDLGRRRSGMLRGEALIIPIVVRGRTIAILYGDDGGADVALDGLGPVLSLSHRAAARVERLILEKKRGKPAPEAPARRILGKPPSSGRPDRGRATAALASVIESGVVVSSSHPPADHRAAERTSWTSPWAPPSSNPPSASVPGRRSFYDSEETLPEGTPLPSDLPGPATDPYLGPPLDDPFALPPPIARPSDPMTPSVQEHRSERPALRPQSAAPEARARFTPTPPPPMEIIRRSSPPPFRSPTPLPPGPLSTRRAGSPPRPEHASLLARAARGGPDGDEARSELSSEARIQLAAVMAHFPGPLSVDRVRARQELPPASECGVLLAVLADLGRPALPFVTTRASSHDVDQRFWATHLLAELPFAEAASSIVPRLFDDDISVRRVARRAAGAILAQRLPDDPIAHSIEDVARSPEESSARRAMAIETLGELRTERLVAPLVRLLEDATPVVPQLARRALLVLTRQDFGVDPDGWAGWWFDNRHRHRVEWLIDALTHNEPALRRAAADELKQLTQEYFGYYDDLPPKERERAKARYREWWEREGQLRFY